MFDTFVRTADEFRRIAEAEKLPFEDTVRLLAKLGARDYRQGRGLLCEYAASGRVCSRRDCCAGEPAAESLIKFRLLKNGEEGGSTGGAPE